MNIDLCKVTNYQKSRVILSALADHGWKTSIAVYPDGRIGGFSVMIDKMKVFTLPPPHYLYDERCMSVMWRVLAWVSEYTGEAVIDTAMATSRPPVVQMVLLDRLLRIMFDAGLTGEPLTESGAMHEIHTTDGLYVWHNWGSDAPQSWLKDHTR